MAKTLWSFGHSECNRVNHSLIVNWWNLRQKIIKNWLNIRKTTPSNTVADLFTAHALISTCFLTDMVASTHILLLAYRFFCYQK